MPFWWPSHTPKLKNFLAHIRTAQKCIQLPDFSHFTFKNAHQRHLQVLRSTTHPLTPNYFKFCTYMRASVNFVKNTFLHTLSAYIRFAPNFLAIINTPTCSIPIKRLLKQGGKYCSPLKLLANQHKRGGALEINSHNSISFNPIDTKLLRYAHISDWNIP